MKRETRTLGECRAVDGDEQGVFEGYAVTWNNTDDYNSQFRKGAFTRTLAERSNKLKVLSNHNDDMLIGRVIEAREDDQGLFVRGQLSLGVQAARETYELLKDGALSALSFGFRTINDMFEQGTRVITEVALYEVSPVPFPASEQAVITGIRAEDFNNTLTDELLQSGGWKSINALNMTLDDIWFGDSSGDDALRKVDMALTDFHGAYMQWASEFVARFRTESRSEIPINQGDNTLASEVRQHLAEQSIDDVVATTALTKTELLRLRRGQIIAEHYKLADLPDSIRAAHQKTRRSALETLCTELRGSLTNAEQKRITALLGIVHRPEPDMNPITETLAAFRQELV